MSKIFIKNATIVTVNRCNEIIRSGYLLISDDKIRALGDMAAPEAAQLAMSADEVIDLENKKTLLPGLIDTHTHSSLFRGVAENMQMWEWLPHYDLEHRSINDADAYYAAKLCYLEALQNGTTCILDMYRNMHMCAKAAGELGIRAQLAPYTANVEPYNFFDTFEQNVQLYSDWHNSYHNRIQVWMGLENIFYCDEKMYRDAVAFCRQNGIRLHTHACEQAEEEAAVKKHFNKTTIEVLDSYGVLGDQTLLAHCVQVSDSDIKLMAQTHTSVAHCPAAAAKLACGVARTPLMYQEGVNVAFGSDGPTCNNSLDLFQEMKFGSLIQKATLLDPTVFDAPDMLRMATINGARAIGQEDKLGSLEVGKQADLVVLDTNAPNLQPIFWDDNACNLLWNIVYSAQGHNVQHVMVAGKWVLWERSPVLIDQSELITAAGKQARDWMVRREAHKKYISAPID